MPVIAFIYFLSISVCISVQFAMSADPVVLLSLGAISALGYFPLLARDKSVGDLIFFGIVLYTGFFSLLIKTLLWQPVQSNLVDADNSALCLAIGTASTFLGYLASQRLKRANFPMRSLASSLSDVGVASGIALPVFTLGFVTQVAQTALRPKIDALSQQVSEGFGGLGTFYFLVLLGLSLQCVLVFRGKRGTGVLLINADIDCLAGDFWQRKENDLRCGLW